MKRSFLPLVLAAAILLGACGTSTAENESAIATGVALTVQALPTSTPEPPTATPLPDLATDTVSTASPTPSAPALSSASYSDCMSASLVSETPPDDTIFRPGEAFIKTWTFQNTSKCTWNASYKLVYWNGDQMGSVPASNLTQSVPPGNTVTVSLPLKAPDAAGTYKGEWKLQTPDGQNFGVGQYSAAVWAQIIVSADKRPAYGITSVTYDLTRNPLTGCPTNVWYYVTANVSFSGPMKEVILQFEHSDGGQSAKFKREITAATTLQFNDEWSLHLGASNNPRWIRLVQIFPEYIAYDKVTFTYDCK